MQTRKLRAVINLSDSIEKTSNFIYSLTASVEGIEAFFKLTKAKKDPEYSKFKKYEFDEAKKSIIWEMGFILLFSNFEYFMYDLVKELVNKYPSSLDEKISINYSEIAYLKDGKDIRSHIIDTHAISKSGKIETWSQHIKSIYGIDIFKSKKDLELILLSSAIRNVVMHSGGKTNARFRQEVRKLIKATIPLNQTIPIDRKIMFHKLLDSLRTIASSTKLNTKIKR